MNKAKSNVNETPGSSRYQGKHAGDTLMEMIVYDNGQARREVVSDFPDAKNDGEVVWINVAGLSDAEIINRLGEKYDIHRIDLEDMVNVIQRSKIEQREHYLFSVQKWHTCWKMQSFMNTSLFC